MSETWRCSGCDALIYNVESRDGKPGAPLVPCAGDVHIPQAYDATPNKPLCNTCIDIRDVTKSPYRYK